MSHVESVLRPRNVRSSRPSASRSSSQTFCATSSASRAPAAAAARMRVGPYSRTNRSQAAGSRAIRRSTSACSSITSQNITSPRREDGVYTLGRRWPMTSTVAPLRVQVTERGEIRLVTLKGRLDQTFEAAIESALANLLEKKLVRVIVDLSGLEYLNSRGV